MFIMTAPRLLFIRMIRTKAVVNLISSIIIVIDFIKIEIVFVVGVIVSFRISFDFIREYLQAVFLFD